MEFYKKEKRRIKHLHPPHVFPKMKPILVNIWREGQKVIPPSLTPKLNEETRKYRERKNIPK